jgi:hypothetical protein
LRSSSSSVHLLLKRDFDLGCSWRLYRPQKWSQLLRGSWFSWGSLPPSLGVSGVYFRFLLMPALTAVFVFIASSFRQPGPLRECRGFAYPGRPGVAEFLRAFPLFQRSAFASRLPAGFCLLHPPPPILEKARTFFRRAVVCRRLIVHRPKPMCNPKGCSRY